jgi:hypothetical protein
MNVEWVKLFGRCDFGSGSRDGSAGGRKFLAGELIREARPASAISPLQWQ